MKFLSIITILLVISLSTGLNAFCIYNYTDKTIYVEQNEGGRGWGRGFSQYIGTGEKACCNWKNKDCNTGGHRDSTVGFKISYPQIDPIKIGICKIKIKAGGYVVVEGKNGHYRCIGGF